MGFGVVAVVVVGVVAGVVVVVVVEVMASSSQSTACKGKENSTHEGRCKVDSTLLQSSHSGIVPLHFPPFCGE